jgi:hypothetical protein
MMQLAFKISIPRHIVLVLALVGLTALLAS